MAIVPAPRGIGFASTGATDETCSREGKSLILLQLGQIQNQWGFMATVEKEGSKICVGVEGRGWTARY